MGTTFMALLSAGSLRDDLSFPCIPQRTSSMSKKQTCIGRNHKYLGVICYCRTGQPAQLGRGPAGHSGWQVQPGNTCRGNCAGVPAGKCPLQQPASQLDGLPDGTHGDHVAIFLSLPCQFSQNPGDSNSRHRRPC